MINRGDTKSSVCLENNIDSRLDLRILSSKSELSLSEFSKEAEPWKYYYDKKKAIIASLTHLKDLIRKGKPDDNNAMNFFVPFVLCEGLESDIYTIRLICDDWTVVEKAGDIDLPTSVDDIKNGNIEKYIQNLKYFKVSVHFMTFTLL